MKWLELAIYVHPVAHDSLSVYLFDLGCTGVYIEDIKGNPLKAYLPANRDSKQLRGRITLFVEQLASFFPEVRSPRLRFSILENQNWESNWRQFFYPQSISSELLIIPSWESPPASYKHTIRIDPGPAFGTGQHPTTRMCLRAMEKVDLPVKWTMLDVGTGSGILSVYGRMQGASKVLAMDIDPEAISWAAHNIAINNLSRNIILSTDPLSQIRETFSLITANLVLTDIIDLLGHFHRLLDVNGWVILSGLLKDQLSEIDDAVFSFGFTKRMTGYLDEWACVIFQKSPTIL